jgi:plastocyanin
MAAASVSASAHAAGRENVRINILDACDPETFAAQQVDCTRAGGVKFDQFIAILTRLGFVGPWHFSPSNVNGRVGESFVAVNQGGEVHTFTEVAQFGGGIVPPLSAGLQQAPECANATVIPAGGKEVIRGLAAGEHRFQCCIHPWMRALIKVEGKNED